MIRLPLEALMPNNLHEVYRTWLLNKGCEDKVDGNQWAQAFLEDVETENYQVTPDVKADAHRLYSEIKYEKPVTCVC